MTPTLSTARCDRLHAFLVAETGAPSLASTRPRLRRPVSFALAASGMAAALLAAILTFTASDVPDAGASRAVRVTPAAGRTVVSLVERDASAAEVIAELRNAGFAVRVFFADGNEDCDLSRCVVGLLGVSLESATGGTTGPLEAADPTTVVIPNDQRAVDVGVAPDRDHRYTYVLGPAGGKR
jgi:hypothetical protein